MSKRYPNIKTVLLHDDFEITEIKLFNGEIIKENFDLVDAKAIKYIDYVDGLGFTGRIISSERKRVQYWNDYYLSEIKFSQYTH